MKTLKPFSLPLLLAGGLIASACAAQTQTVSKLADLFAGQDGNGTGYGPSGPRCHFTVVGTNLWFTSYDGGGVGAGGVFAFDPATGNVTQLATLDNDTGKSPWAASLTIAQGQGWFTTAQGGAGNKGSLCRMNLDDFTVTNVFSFPTNADFGWSPHSTPMPIGDDLWFTTSSGGLAPNGATTYGAIVKYNPATGSLTNVFSLDGTNTGRQPLGSGLVRAGDDYFYLTFAGGTNTVGGAPNGAGVLGRLAFDLAGQPSLKPAAQLPGHFVSFPAGDPVFDGGSNLYFTTVGVATNPGAIVRFNLADQTLTSLFNFVTNAAAVTNFGKQPYGTPVLYGNDLFFTTFAGGTAGKGVLGKLSLADNTVTKLADFSGPDAASLGASPQYNGGTIYTNPADGRIGIYFPINKGGANNFGAIVRVALPPPPITATLAAAGAGQWRLSWTGGYAPFQVDAQFSALAGAWTTNWLGPLEASSVTFPATSDNAFFRVQGAAE